MKPWLALFLVVLMVFTVAGCKFPFGAGREPGADPSGDPGTDPGGDPGDDPGPGDTGEWKTVDGEFYTFSEDDISFVLAFKELHFTYSDEFENLTFKSQYLGDEEIQGINTRHYSFTGIKEDESTAGFWFTEAGDLMQVADAGGYVDSHPGAREFLSENWLFEFCLAFVYQHCIGEGFHLGDIYTDPSVFATADHDYQVREISTREADLGAGAVTIHRYDYSSVGYFDVVEEIAKIGEKYLFISSTTTLEGGHTTILTITRAIPFK